MKTMKFGVELAKQVKAMPEKQLRAALEAELQREEGPRIAMFARLLSRLKEVTARGVEMEFQRRLK